ncbi:anti-sigma factor [Aquabacterium sp.]|uniref:anti-sigma factor n=1 Tax=Aquabacterium sp. TaxID=1872578 RepID=UPI003D6CC553
MDYSRTERADRLAAEYVLGTLSGRARRRFETLLPAHPQLRRSVNDWQERLVPLVDVVPEVQPSPQVWQALQRRLFSSPADAAMAQGASGWWQRLALWRGFTAFSTVAALSLGLWLAQPQVAAPPIVIVMAAQPGTPAGLQNASFVVSVAGDGRSLVFKPLSQLPVGLDKALELWVIPGQGAPRSLGLVSADGATTVLRQQLLKGTAAFAVSVEPTGGSPTGTPTGPVISVGKLQV